MYLEKLRLDGQAAVVTGCGRGIGLACAEALAEAGAQVVLLDVSLEIAEAGRDYLRGMGFAADSFVLDVTKPAEVTAMADRLGRVDILVANAGIGGPNVPAEDTLDETWLRVNDVNYNGVFWCNRAFGKHMLGAGKGAIVNIGSMSGYIANRPARQTYYNASKAAAWSMTQSLRASLGSRHIEVFGVFPGAVDTDMLAGVEMPKTSPADVAKAIVLGIMEGREDIFPDQMSQQLYSSWRQDHKAVEKQFATM